MRSLFLNIIIVSSLIIMGCQSKSTQKKDTNKPVSETNNINQITVVELIEGSTYSYINGTNGTENIWVAIRKAPVEIGKTYYYSGELAMKDFYSKELDKTFPLIYFLNGLSDKAEIAKPSVHIGKMKKQAQKKLEVNIPLEDGILSIAELFENKNKYANTQVIVKGKVAKFNSNIMGRNWIHLQDGSEYEGYFDLVITSQETVSVGEVVTFEGKIAINKDFGAGYTYEVILENASSKKIRP